jgi:hypothetical protein
MKSGPNRLDSIDDDENKELKWFLSILSVVATLTFVVLLHEGL